MAAIAKQLKTKLSSHRYNNIVYGWAEGIFYNIRFIRHKRGSNFRHLMDSLMEPKYVSAMFDVFAIRDGGIDLQEVNRFLQLNYPVYWANKATYTDGRFSILLYRNNSVNIKVNYVVKFLKALSAFLSEHGYYSVCALCGGNDTISYTYTSDMIKEICGSCSLNVPTISADSR